MEINGKLILGACLLERTYQSILYYYRWFHIPHYYYEYELPQEEINEWNLKMYKDLQSDIGIVIETPEGEVIVEWGDYILQGNYYVRKRKDLI